MARQLYTFVAVVVSLVLLAVLVSVLPASPVTGAPASVPTPVAAVERNAYAPTLYSFFDAETMTADTTSSCFALANYDIADIYYNIDQGTTNTTTLTMRFGNSPSALVNGTDIVTSNAADASDMQQLQLFGRYTCILANVSNTNTITITVNALAK